MKKSTRRLPTAPVEINGKTFSIPAPQNGKMEGCVRVLNKPSPLSAKNRTSWVSMRCGFIFILPARFHAAG